MDADEPGSDLDAFGDDVRLVAALAEPVRLSLFRYVVSQPEPVGRDEAAESLGIARHVAKFHLDKLESDGLLDVEYRRPPGRRGPGAGRPAKLYRRSGREVSVTLPARHYEVAGRVMARALTAAAQDGAEIVEALRESALAEGAVLGDDARRRAGRRHGQRAQLRAAGETLAGCGYEPRASGDRMELANCPFHSLAEDFPDLVCGVNLDLIEGLLAQLPATALRARLDPLPGRCCVTIGPAGG